MKSTVIALSCLLGLFFAENEATAAEGRATATIMPAISASKNTNTDTNGDLAFGVIVPGESSGTVTISPSTSNRTYRGGVALVASTSGAASFNITGSANAVYTVTLPDTDTIDISSAGNIMKVQSFTIHPPSGSANLGADGQAIFNVGGTLLVEPNQAAGSYTGTFQVTVAYQ